MVTAITLIKCQRRTINETAEALANTPGIAEVYSVAGAWDLVTIARTRTNDELAEVVTKRMRTLDGIVDSQTLIAFRAFSKFDLAEVFNLGLD